MTEQRTETACSKNDTDRELLAIEKDGMMRLIRADIRTLLPISDESAHLRSHVMQTLLFKIFEYFSAFELNGLTEDEFHDFKEVFRKYFERYSDYIHGDSDAFLRTYAVRLKKSTGQSGDSTKDRNRYWAIAAARALIKMGQSDRDCYSLAAEALGDVSTKSLKEWLWYRRRKENSPDARPLRPRLYAIETQWIKGAAGLKGPGWTQELAWGVLKRARDGDAFPVFK